MFPHLTKVMLDRKGASTIEYGMLLGLVVIVIFVAMQSFAGESISMWERVSDKSASAMSGQ